jgi:hypothetical protein
MLSNEQKSILSLRVHGDNIIECERALLLIADSFSASTQRVASPPCLPRYEIKRKEETLFTIELFAGHGRWNINMQDILQNYGAPLREATDAAVTRVSHDGEQEELILAFEFCNALPAGNNAWQRNGRALACATVGVPYLYFAEIGGVELDKNRIIKAPRFPNPIVSFSYLTASKSFNVVCLPVYLPSPSSSENIRVRFGEVFGLEEGRRLVRCILENTSPDDSYEKLTRKALTITEILAAQRRSVDTLRGKQWAEFLDLETADRKATWLEQNRMDWSKTISIRTTETFQSLFRLFQEVGPVSVGANNIPLCLIPRHAREVLSSNISALYGDLIAAEFIEWVASLNSPLIVVWITGFKPGGEDSRPDRGLVPLARMLFGNEVDILSVVYGPARPAMWNMFEDSPQQLARQNGLWEAIINLSDAVLVDSTTAPNSPLLLLLHREHRRVQEKVRFPSATPTTVFSEQDVDTILHLLFTQSETAGTFEAMCNPPGGDWSGLSILSFETGQVFRWTSLPRVSGVGGKRPDHVVQFSLVNGRLILLAIESKNRASDLKPDVGLRLKTYIQQLVKTPPTISKAVNAPWILWQKDEVPLPAVSFMSGGAFCWKGIKDLENSIVRGQLDIAFAVEFRPIEQSALLHVKATSSAEFLLPKINDLIQQFGGRLETQIH